MGQVIANFKVTATQVSRLNLNLTHLLYEELIFLLLKLNSPEGPKALLKVRARITVNHLSGQSLASFTLWSHDDSVARWLSRVVN